MAVKGRFHGPEQNDRVKCGCRVVQEIQPPLTSRAWLLEHKQTHARNTDTRAISLLNNQRLASLRFRRPNRNGNARESP